MEQMKRYIGIKELAEALSVSEKTIYHWTHEQRIPHYKIGGLVRFDPEQIERWIKKREVKPIQQWWKE